MTSKMISKINFANDSAGKMKGDRMTRVRSASTKSFSRGKFAFILAALAMVSTGCSKSQRSSETGSASSVPQTFASSDVAAQAVYNAAKTGDTNALLAIFGSGAKELLLSGDPVQDKDALDTFTRRYDEMHRWGKLTRGGLVLDVGAENYPFPFALRTNAAGQWYFDTDSAKAEIVARRIGGNELSTIEILNAMKDAQTEYFSEPHDGNKAHMYAQKFVSDDGKQNGLYWKVAEGEPESPLGPLAAYASSEGYTNSQGQQPYHGYFFRMISKQGSQAQGGAKDYVVNGNMTGGFAILAYPAEYGNSGVMSFLINQNGDVFEKDLGAGTSDAAKAVAAFDPDDTWTLVE
jgi:Protein of unknown function (DUF2950)